MSARINPNDVRHGAVLPIGGRGVQPDPKGGRSDAFESLGGMGGVWRGSSNPVRRQFEGVFEASGHLDDMHARTRR